MALILARSHGDKPVPRQYLGIGCCVSKRAKRTFSDHILSLQNLPYIPNRIITSGENRSSCIFTQQGRKGINQDAMIVWESFFHVWDTLNINKMLVSGNDHGRDVTRRYWVFMMNVAAAAPVVYCKKVLETSKTRILTLQYHGLGSRLLQDTKHFVTDLYLVFFSVNDG
ncbi:hypothetical protein Bca4012_083791 [Brassica carinata]